MNQIVKNCSPFKYYSNECSDEIENVNLNEFIINPINGEKRCRSKKLFDSTNVKFDESNGFSSPVKPLSQTIAVAYSPTLNKSSNGKIELPRKAKPLKTKILFNSTNTKFNETNHFANQQVTTNETNHTVISNYDMPTDDFSIKSISQKISTPDSPILNNKVKKDKLTRNLTNSANKAYIKTPSKSKFINLYLSLFQLLIFNIIFLESNE